MTARSPSRNKELLIKMLITSAFLGLFVGFIAWMLLFGPGLEVFNLGWLELILLGLATYRMGHLLSYDSVMEPLRSFFTETIPDPTGEGESVEPKGKGFQQVIGQLLCCPICTGTWSAAMMVYAMYLWPAPARVFVTILAVVGIAEFLNAAGELFSWGGQYARTASGAVRRQQQNVNEHILTSRDLHLDGNPSNPQHLNVEDTIFSRRLEK
jgi:hypothetical protein